MEQFHPAAKEFICQKIKEKGFSLQEISALAGYKNTNKGLRKISSFLRSGRIEPELLKRLFDVFGIDAQEMNALLCREKIETEELFFEQWKQQVNMPQAETKGCQRCPFYFHHNEVRECDHPLSSKSTRRLYVSRWVGVVRPQWCPLLSQIKP